MINPRYPLTLVLLILSVSAFSEEGATPSGTNAAPENQQVSGLPGEGDAGTRSDVGIMYAGGQEVTENLVEAYKWILLGERNGKEAADNKAWLKEHLTAKQITEAQKQAAAVSIQSSNSVTPYIAPAGLANYISRGEGVIALFPSLPKQTVIQNNERLFVVHYQALSDDGLSQYNASFHRFKKQNLLDKAAQTAFLEDYLVGRAMFAWKNKIQTKEMKFRGLNAAMFRHTVFFGDTGMVHEGLIFFIANGDFVSLTCVHPANGTPSPTFNEYINSVDFISVNPSNSPIEE